MNQKATSAVVKKVLATHGLKYIRKYNNKLTHGNRTIKFWAIHNNFNDPNDENISYIVSEINKWAFHKVEVVRSMGMYGEIISLAFKARY